MLLQCSEEQCSTVRHPKIVLRGNRSRAGRQATALPDHCASTRVSFGAKLKWDGGGMFEVISSRIDDSASLDSWNEFSLLQQQQRLATLSLARQILLASTPVGEKEKIVN